ncbi:hypothetical protein T01_11253 [Trichinella spiralis]|uniref:Uncharacterized protein n=1 Tax=Trichinella spiralis TaxID=6334 RepID=A0A0V1BVK4_TRISP|nr:hypothetical protein T01_11253 [Trichinella spiralis]
MTNNVDAIDLVAHLLCHSRCSGSSSTILKMNSSKESQPKVTHEEFQNELRNFDSDQLRHIEPTEKVVLPSKEDVIQEKVEIAHQNVLVDVSQFQRHSLQHADTNERVYLPTKDEVKQERMEQAYTGVLKEVSTFERNSLTHSEPVEKYHMPTKEELAREKVMHQVPGFDQSKLKHAETVIKTTVDVIDDK